MIYSLSKSVGRALRILDRSEEWLGRHITTSALLIIAVGLAFRIYFAASCYLNPDEALHLVLSRVETFRQMYLNSLSQAHPPFLFVVQFLLKPLGSSELFVRTPSLIAATLASWLAFRWAKRTFDSGTAIGVLAVLTFSPGMLLPAVEVRQYGLLLLGSCGALCYLQSALEEDSKKEMVLAHLFLYLAILSHYSGAWVTGALGLYGLVSLFRRKAQRSTWVAWILLQLGAAGLYLALFFTHVKGMYQGPMLSHAVDNYLKRAYFHGGSQELHEFLLNGIKTIFRYLAGSNVTGSLAILLFFLGCVFLLIFPPRKGDKKRPELALLLAAPLILGAVGTLFDLQPFRGSRHVTYLYPFVASAICFAFFRWFRHRVLLASLAAAAGPALLAIALSYPWYIPNNRPDMLPLAEMEKALSFIDMEVPVDRPLLADSKTALVLNYWSVPPGNMQFYLDTVAPGTVDTATTAFEIHMNETPNGGAPPFFETPLQTATRQALPAANEMRGYRFFRSR